MSSKRLSEIQQETGRDGRRWDEPWECRSEEGRRGQGSFPTSSRSGLILMDCRIDFFFNLKCLILVHQPKKINNNYKAMSNQKGEGVGLGLEARETILYRQVGPH